MLNHENGQVVVNYDSSVTIALGDGEHDTVEDYSDGRNLVTLGNGAHDTVSASTLYGDVIIVGNGHHDTVYAYNPFGFSYVQTGTGSGDAVWLATTYHFGVGNSLGDVSFGGPDATLNLSATAGESFSFPTTADQVSIDTDRLDVISGLVKGDHIVLSMQFGIFDNTDTLATSSNLAGVADEAHLTAGTYVANGLGGGTFTESATGHDALLTYDTQGAGGLSGFVSVVLVGAAHEIAGSTIHLGTITLG